MFFDRKKPIIFIDIDDTLADTRRAVYDLYVAITGDIMANINTKTKRYNDFCPKWTDDDIEHLFKNGYTLYGNAKPLPGAVEGVKTLLDRGYDVRIATMHASRGMEAKHDWIEKYFPELEDKIYYIDYRLSNKDVFRGYAIIDDDLKNIKTNQSAKPILLDVYNIYSDLEGYIKCKSWNEVLTLL